MDRGQIYNLSQLIPRETGFFSGSPFQILVDDDVSYETEKFARCYSNPAFGWHIVKLYADQNLPFPVCQCATLSELEEYDILREAYMFLRFSEGHEDLIYAAALESSMDPYYKNVLRGCLLVEDIEAEEISRKTGIPENVIVLYEKLFYNVWDRLSDQMYIAALVNPEGMVAELNPNFQLRTSYADLLKRAGYKNSIEDVLSLAGMKGHAVLGTTQNIVAEFENKLMANALFLANNGMLNTRNQVGISNAKNLLAAAKHGGDTDIANNDNIGIGGIAEVLNSEIISFNQADVDRRRVLNIEHEESKLKETAD